MAPATGIVTGNDFQQRRTTVIASLGDTVLATEVHENGTITVTARGGNFGGWVGGLGGVGFDSTFVPMVYSIKYPIQKA